MLNVKMESSTNSVITSASKLKIIASIQNSSREFGTDESASWITIVNYHTVWLIKLKSSLTSLAIHSGLTHKSPRKKKSLVKNSTNGLSQKKSIQAILR